MIKRIEKWNICFFWVVVFILVIIIRLTISVLLQRLLHQSYNNPTVNEFDNSFIFYSLVFIIIPFVETLIFYFISFNALLFVKSKYHLNKSIIIFVFIAISSFLFSLNHMYNIMYFISSLFGGMLYGFIYWLSFVKRKNPLLVVSVLHSAYNIVVFLIAQIK